MGIVVLEILFSTILLYSVWKLVRAFSKRCPDCGSRHNHTVHAGVFVYQACNKCGYPNIKNEIISYNNRVVSGISPKLIRNKQSA